MDKTVLICEDSFDGIMTAVYKAWEIKKHTLVSIAAGEVSQFEMFCEYKDIDTDFELSKKVIRTLNREFGSDLYLSVYRAAMSCHPNKAEYIYQFLIDAFKVGRKITDCLSYESVMNIFELERNVMNETHHYLGFVRFSQLDSDILFSEISPKNNVVASIAPHFADRLSGENWIIYDKKRKIAAVHKAMGNWFLLSGEDINRELISREDETEESIKNLWKIFFKTIAIESRTNPKLQRNLMPLRFRDKMTEFR